MELIITASEVARELGVSRQRVQQFIREGRLVGVRVGHSRLFERREVERFKATRTSRVTLDDTASASR